MLEPLTSAAFTIDAAFDLSLDRQHCFHQIGVLPRDALPSPVDKNGFATAADRACPSFAQAERDGEMMATRGAAIVKKLAMHRANAMLGERPISPYPSVAAGNMIGC
ncbi:hypothetical protein AKG12_26150 [Agrobacterium sp. SUL3]|nr:hypothetical protein AKG12_26150 [Agrobacterium sp. SUL3]